ncbi:MAG: mechanosensitive ion channel [bacterium]|nr:mechanosensitive ion channel [bacterium]
MDLDKLKAFDLQHAFDYRLFEIAGTSITVATLVLFLLIIILSFLISSLVSRAMGRVFRKSAVQHEGSIHVAQRLTHYLILIVGLGIGFETIGVDLGTLFAAGAVLAVGIGFAMQNLAQNFVSGVILLIERSIKPGDVLQVDNQFVRVTKMAIRTTHARTLDDEEIIVPNATIVQSTVTNYTLRDSYYRLRTSVGVLYSSDMALVRNTLESVAAGIDWRSKNKDPVVLLTEFGNSSVIFEVSVWISDPWAVRRRRSDLNESIWWALKDAGITIAFPQVDLHLDPPVMKALEGMTQSAR